MTTNESIDWSAYALPEEIREFVSTARAHFASLSNDDQLRAISRGEALPSLWPTLVEHGYTSVGYPEEIDGLGRFADLAALIEVAGQALLPAPLTTHAAATQLLLAVGFSDHSLTSSQHAVAEQSGGQLFAFDATGATFAVYVVATPTGTQIRRVKLDNAESRPVASVDPSRPTLQFELNSLEVIDEINLLVTANNALASARICLAADLVGVSERALRGAIAHALSREQFGRPIGSFQTVKHQLADAHVLIERARSLTIGASVEISVDPLGHRATQLSLLAKASAAEAAARVTALHVQLLGAMGLTFEADSALEVRRARHTMPVLGSPGELYAASAASTISERNIS